MFPTRCSDKQVKQKNSIKKMRSYNTMLADERPEYKAMNYAAVIKELSSNGRRELKWENSTDISPHWA